MRVLYFTRDYTPHDYRFLTSLAESGQEVLFLRLERRGRQVEDRPLPPEVEQIVWRGGQKPFSWRSLPATALALRRVFRQRQPDVIHAGPVQSCAFLTALAGGRPLVTMSWGSDLLVDAHQNPWMKGITRFTLHRSDMLVGDCQAVQQAAESFGFSGERVVLFPWGVDVEKFSPGGSEDGLRERLGWKDAFVILSLRSWEPIYGVDCVVRAFARAAEAEPRLRLLLLGSGSLAGKIQSMIYEHHLHERVHLGGQVSQRELPRYYRAADLYVSASHSDGSSVSLLEALASGLPVLVSDIPGNREWIEEGVTGWLFPDGDAEALAAGMLKAVAAGSALNEMGGRARALAEERADWRKNFPKLLTAYQQGIEFTKRRIHRHEH